MAIYAFAVTLIAYPIGTLSGFGLARGDATLQGRHDVDATGEVTRRTPEVTPESRLGDLLSRLRTFTDPPRAERVDRLQRRLVEGRMRLLLVGEAKRGKSTLGNALIGRAVLPAGVVPVTAVTTTVREGSPERLEVRTRDGAVRTEDVGSLADFVTEERNPGNRLGVEEARVFLTRSCLPPGVELVDTPGTGSVYPHNTAEAEAALTSMDAAILVVSADPPISAAELGAPARGP